MKIQTMGLILVAATALNTTAARADLTIEMKHNATTQTIHVAEHKIAMNMEGKDMIFRGDKKVVWIVDVAAKTFTEMNEADAKAMGEKVSGAMAQMQEAMKNMPPEQRAAMESMMAGKMTHLAAAKRTVKPLGEKRTINGFPCAGYQVLGETTQTEVWAADPKDLKIESKDMTAFKELADFMTSALPGMDQVTDFLKDFDHPRADQVPGFPVLTIARDKEGKDLWRTELVKVDKSELKPATFEIPSGLTKTKGFGQE